MGVVGARGALRRVFQARHMPGEQLCRENNYAGRTIMPGEHARPGSCRPPSDPTHTVLFLSTAPLFENKVTPRFTAEKR